MVDSAVLHLRLGRYQIFHRSLTLKDGGRTAPGGNTSSTCSPWPGEGIQGRVFGTDSRRQVHCVTQRKGQGLINNLLISIPTLRSYLLRDLSRPLSDVTVTCILVGVYETLLEGGTLLGSWPDIALSVPEAVHQTSFVLSLMLVRERVYSYND